MLLHLSLIWSLLTVSCLTSPVDNPHVVHEKRDSIPYGWLKRSQLDGRMILPMKVALAQNNLDKAHDWLMDVSHPASNKYGKHWSAEDIAKTFAPSSENVQAVKAWLASAGISHDRIEQTQSLGWLKFDATVDEAESLLHTKYHVYEHRGTGQQHVACEEYSIPQSMRERVDFVTPTVHFDAKLKPRDDSKMDKREISPGVDRSLGQPGSGSLPKLNRFLPYSDIVKQLQDCDLQITPWCLRALYDFPPGFSANSKNSYGIVEYTPQAYVPSDLDLFFRNFSTKQVGQRPMFDSVDGGFLYNETMSFDYNGESNLDLEYAMSLVYPQNVTLYQVGDAVEGGSFNDFLDAIDGSYCTYDGGDDSTQDAVYPDPYCDEDPGEVCYTGPKDCGGFAATKVISTSYSYNEHDLTPFYEMRQCQEYMKLGMMGVSVLYSSGDYGVAGNSGQCINGTGEDAPYNNGTTGRFNPSFPGTCPYITSVGATQVIPGTDIIATRTEPEQACETVIYSGGGFSNVFPLPDYQSSAVKSWFENHPPPYGADRFNNSQQTRGFPDISANGANYVVAIDGQWALVYGTSASSPTLGSVLTLINEARYNAGKSSIGFVNPVAYEHPEVFNDITQGGNQGCGTPGFTAVSGWDPVTGLGTPNYPKMLALWLGLD
ncbi:probable tripeptidyl-peptidase 1 precursor [Lecanosticta acicola]|uniref:tripeptidyl-peptidase II n=1 Tax=Lecanosticta acicola TaxID=111012 RepID=A0AAI9EDG1_9PEZI|nr:probable tripeptidyl-peptidase 1 precursor [Lecanosticta acicola]